MGILDSSDYVLPPLDMWMGFTKRRGNRTKAFSFNPVAFLRIQEEGQDVDLTSPLQLMNSDHCRCVCMDQNSIGPEAGTFQANDAESGPSHPLSRWSSPCQPLNFHFARNSSNAFQIYGRMPPRPGTSGIEKPQVGGWERSCFAETLSVRVAST
ncbi:uncharacterized protein IWZ02DRAFT_287734 [Phyllosticta citriasiana]|uniref:uncharacterized protein n=1 Tax=Phyllosticta citriasiana TaxID=595635 RepID=UPI0030FD22A8